MPFNAKNTGMPVPNTQPTSNQFTGVQQSAPANFQAGHASAIENQPTANIEEKVAQLSLQFNQILVKPYLQQALDYLKSSKTDAVNSYNQLSDQIAAEIKIITENANIIALRLQEANDVINRVQEVIRNKYNNATEEEISSGELNLEYEYNVVAEHYELSLQLTQEISNYKARVSSLTNLQELLDNSTVPFIGRIQVEIDNLELLVHNFDSSSYADLLAKKRGVVGNNMFAKNNMVGRSRELNTLTSDFLNKTSVGNAPKVENMVRKEDFANEKIVTNEYKTEMHEEEKPHFHERRNKPMKSKRVVVDSENFEDESLSAEEIKMMKKMREQQRKFEHMMKMNEMIFEYNQKVDQMVARQREYENLYKQQEAMRQAEFNSYQQATTPMNAMPAAMPNYTSQQNDMQVRPLREFGLSTDSDEKAISKNDSTKSIRVVK